MSSLQPQPAFPGMNPQPQQTPPLSPQANQLAQQPQPQIQQPQSIARGSIVVFPYALWKHDPLPCVLVSSINNYVLKGVNLHYLTFQYIKRLLVPNANNPSFSYYNIRADQYIVSAFRSYLVRGIMFDKARVIDAQFLIKMMAMVKSFDPLQIRAIRQEIERQLYQGYQQPQADQMVAPQYPQAQQPVPQAGPESPIQ